MKSCFGSRMQKLVLTLLLGVSLPTNCNFFKESSLDPNSPINSFLDLTRLIYLSESLNSTFVSTMMVRFRDANGNALTSGYVEYSVENDLDKDPSIPEDIFGTSGKFSAFSATLDATGFTYLHFYERGLAQVYLYTDGTKATLLGSFVFKTHTDLDLSNYQLLASPSNLQMQVIDIATYKNEVELAEDFQQLGMAGERQFFVFENEEEHPTDPSGLYYRQFIASSSDGITFDQVFRIEGIANEILSSGNTVALTYSRPGFDGFQYIFFVKRVVLDNSNTPLTVEHYVLQIPLFFPPTSLTPIEFPVGTGKQLVLESTTIPNAPMLTFAGGWLTFVDDFPTPNIIVPRVQRLDGTILLDYSSPNLSACQTGIYAHYLSFQVFTYLDGSRHLHCGVDSNLNTPSITFLTVDEVSLTPNGIQLDVSGFNSNFSSLPFLMNNGIYSLAQNTSDLNHRIFSFPVDSSYFLTNPMLAANPPVPGSSTGFGTGSASAIQEVWTSSGNHFLMLMQDPFNLTSGYRFYGSNDNLTTVRQLSTTPVEFGSADIARYQFSVAGGKLHYYWSFPSAPDTIPSYAIPVFHVRDGGFATSTWERAQLLKVKP